MQLVTLRDNSKYIIKKRRTLERTIHDFWGSIFLTSYIKIPETFMIINDDDTLSVGQEYLAYPRVKRIDDVLSTLVSRNKFLICYLVFHPDLFNVGNLFLDNGEVYCVDNESFGLLQVGAVPEPTNLHCRTRMDIVEKYRHELELGELGSQELSSSFRRIPHIDHEHTIETMGIDAKIQNMLNNHSELRGLL